MKIGCKDFPIENWLNFSNDEINGMDENALTWWKKWKPSILVILENTKVQSNGENKWLE